MKIRFQADEDFNEDIVSGVLRRVPEIDFQTSSEANLKSLTDFEVLAVAARERRVLVTHDRKTMALQFGRFIETAVSRWCLYRFSARWNSRNNRRVNPDLGCL